MTGAGIRVLPFKDPALAQCVYGDIALREFSDLDLLVEPGTSGSTRELLRARAADWSPGGGWAVSVDVQEQPLSPFYCSRTADWQAIWDRSVFVTISGTQVRTLCPEDYLVILCGHGTKHCWDRLMWLYDVAALMRRHQDLDWRTVRSSARRLGLERALSLTVLLIRRLLGDAVPPGLAAVTEGDVAANRLCSTIGERIVTASWPWPRSLRRLLFRVRARERIEDQIHYLRSQMGFVLRRLRSCGLHRFEYRG